ncbi:MATE family efflux transporter [Clostridium sp. KNHs205]|uniref:MATE family efflux transporter n=1 Tax=Clostridium sp. KNHs205 TaxID=1449050 RepID=UPI00068A46CC|nr:MATE family efflux transporter [Clostridium sp. KNHs205]
MENKYQSLLGEASVSKLIWKMSIPSIIGVMAYNIYNIIDTIYVAKGVGTNAAGGLAVSFPLFLFLSAVTTTLGSGAASVMSRAFGEKDYEKANKTAANTIGLFYFIAILVTIFGLIFLNQLLYAMGVMDSLLPYAKSYTRIILIGAVTSTAFSSLIRAEGSSKYAMYVWVIPMLTNIILDPVFIFGFQMGVSGAAVATVIAQCVSVVMSIYYFFLSGKSSLKIKLRHFIPNGKILQEIVFIGMPSFVQMFGYSISIIIINQILKKYGGDLSISTYGIVSKINTFLIIPMNGILQGIQPIIGYNYGAQKKQRVWETIKRASFITGIYGAVISLSLIVLAEPIMYIFTSDPAVIRMGSYILKIINIGILFSGIQSIQSTYFQAVGKKLASLILSLCNYILCFIPVTLIMSGIYELNGVWYSFPISTIMSLFISTIFLINSLRKELYESGEITTDNE